MTDTRTDKEKLEAFEAAMEIAEDMDLSDSAFWVLAHELADLEYGDGFQLIAEKMENSDDN